MRAEISHNDELLKRFGLLDKHYSSDLSRLEFINEGEQNINQLNFVPCPICGKIMEEHLFRDIKEKDEDDKLEQSLFSEASKIQVKQVDLRDMLKELVRQNETTKNDFDNKKIEFNKIDSHIKNRLKPLVEINRTNLQTFLDMKDKKTRLSTLIEEIEALKADKGFYFLKFNKRKSST